MKVINEILRAAEIQIKEKTGMEVKLSISVVPETIRMKPADMIQTIGLALGLTPEEMNSNSRVQQIVIFRQVSCYFLRLYYRNLSLAKIGKLMICYHEHTSVLHSISKVKNAINKAKDYLETNDRLIVDAYNIALAAINKREINYEDYY